MSDSRAHGRIWQIYRKRWFGFIRDEQNRSVFFRKEDVDEGVFETLRVNDAVLFDTEGDAEGGLQAKNVKITSEESK